MSGLERWALLLSGSEGSGFPCWRPDIRGLGKGRMSGLARPDAGACSFWRLSGYGGRSSRGRTSGSWPDVRDLGGVLDSFCWFSSSVNLGTCTSSCSSSGGSSSYLIMHNNSDLGSSHVSCIESRSWERSEFTLSLIALARAVVIGPSGVVEGVGASMGMIMGCSASAKIVFPFMQNTHKGI